MEIILKFRIPTEQKHYTAICLPVEQALARVFPKDSLSAILVLAAVQPAATSTLKSTEPKIRWQDKEYIN